MQNSRPVPTLLVMAAGLGSRYGGFKQVDRVGPAGEMLLEYAIFDARRAGFRRVVFVIRRELANAFADLERQLPADLDVSWVYQDPNQLPSWFTSPPRTKPWGTAHAVLAAREAISAPFIVVNADDFYGMAAYDLAAAACREAAERGTLALIGLPLHTTLSDHGTVVRGICRLQGDWLVELDEVYGIECTNDGIRGSSGGRTRALTGTEMASMNLWVFAPALFSQLAAQFEEFLRNRGQDATAEMLLPDAIGALVRTGAARVRAIEAPGPWFGLTHKEDRPKVMAGLRALHVRGDYPDPLWRRP